MINHVSGHKAGIAGVYNRATYNDEKKRHYRIGAITSSRFRCHRMDRKEQATAKTVDTHETVASKRIRKNNNFNMIEFRGCTSQPIV